MSLRVTSAHAGVDDFEIDLVALDIEQARRERLGRAIHVGLDVDAERFLARLGDGREEVVDGGSPSGGALGGFELLAFQFVLLGHPLGLAFVLHRDKGVACGRRARPTNDLDRHGGRRGFDRLVLVVEEHAHAAIVFATNQRGTRLERTLLHDHRCGRASTQFLLGLEDDPFGGRRRVGHEVFHDLGLQEDRIEQFIDAIALQRGDLGGKCLTAPTLPARGRAPASDAGPCRGWRRGCPSC